MIVWCSYCQRFLGERDPFDNLEVTHAMCAQCSVDFDRIATSPVGDRIQEIASFFRDLLGRSLAGTPPDPSEVIAAGRALSIRDTDLLMGVIQPVLYEIGRQFEVGLVPSRHERALSERVEQILATFEQHRRPADATSPRVLLCLAPGNHHSIGARTLTHLLADHGVAATCLTDGRSAGWLDRLGDQHYDLVGISAALPSQLHRAWSAIDEMRRVRPDVPIALGGCVLKDEPTLKEAQRFDFVANPRASHDTAHALLQMLTDLPSPPPEGRSRSPGGHA